MNILEKIFSKSEPSTLTEEEKRFVEWFRQTRPDTPSTEPLGDGGAVFISDATDEEYEEYVHNEKHGWGKFKEILDIIKRK